MSTPQNAGKAAARCIWFTGLSGSGKTTLADQLAEWLDDRDISAIVLDGDQVRRGLNRDLGFSREDRRESVRRLAELAHLLVDAGMVALVSTVSPYREDRARARALLQVMPSWKCMSQPTWKPACPATRKNCMRAPRRVT